MMIRYKVRCRVCGKVCYVHLPEQMRDGSKRELQVCADCRARRLREIDGAAKDGGGEA